MSNWLKHNVQRLLELVIMATLKVLIQFIQWVMGIQFFVLSTNEVDGMVDAVGILAVEVISKCIQRAIKKAKSGYGLLAYQDLKNNRKSI